MSSAVRPSSARRLAAVVVSMAMAFTWLTVAASLAAWPFGLSLIYGGVAILAGGYLVVEAHRLTGRSRRGEPLKPMRLFHASITYLTVLFLAVAVDALVG